MNLGQKEKKKWSDHHRSVLRLHTLQTPKELLIVQVDSYFFQSFPSSRVKESLVLRIGVSSREGHLTGPRVPWILTSLDHEKPQVIRLRLEEDSHSASRLFGVGAKRLMLTCERPP